MAASRMVLARVPAAEPSGLVARLAVVAVALVYASFLIQTYEELSKLWSYLGFWYQPPPAAVTTLSIVAAALLGALLPLGNWTVVGFAKWVLYFVLFIPALVIPPQQGVLLDEDLGLLAALIWVSAALMMLLLRDGQPFAPLKRLPPLLLWQGVIAAWVLGNAALLAVYGGSLNLAGLDQVYEQRASAASLGGAAIAYVMGTLAGAINPFLLVVGLTRRRPLFVALALTGQLLIYATLAGKVVLGSTLLTVGTFFAFSHGRVVFARIYAAVLAFAVLGPVITAPRATAGFLATLSDLIYMRILVLPGVLVGAYTEFFLRFPVTHLSHSLVGRPFATYPYGAESVGQVIGRWVTPSTAAAVNNYNASFIAADGIAGFGTWGVPIIFLIVAAWLWLMSRLVGRTDRPLACAMLMPFVVSLADSSIFTAILTGGGAVAAVLLYLYRSATHPHAAVSSEG